MLDEILANQSMILVPVGRSNSNHFNNRTVSGPVLTQQTEQFEKYLQNKTVKEDKVSSEGNEFTSNTSSILYWFCFS